mgnify:CR=1 FL=1
MVKRAQPALHSLCRQCAADLAPAGIAARWSTLGHRTCLIAACGTVYTVYTVSHSVSAEGVQSSIPLTFHTLLSLNDEGGVPVDRLQQGDDYSVYMVQ